MIDLLIRPYLANSGNYPSRVLIAEVTEQTKSTIVVNAKFKRENRSYRVCRVCERELKTPLAMAIGLGPTCAEKLSMAYDEAGEFDTELAAYDAALTGWELKDTAIPKNMIENLADVQQLFPELEKAVRKPFKMWVDPEDESKIIVDGPFVSHNFNSALNNMQGREWDPVAKLSRIANDIGNIYNLVEMLEDQQFWPYKLSSDLQERLDQEREDISRKPTSREVNKARIADKMQAADRIDWSEYVHYEPWAHQKAGVLLIFDGMGVDYEDL